MFEQIRGLFRHVPFTDHDFAVLAPNVAETLNPQEPYEALVVLWDVIDSFEKDDKLQALITLLGLDHRTGNVLDRKNALDNTKHPRTHARRADAAIWRLVSHIEKNFIPRAAEVQVWWVEQDVSKVSLMFTWFGDMDVPIAKINGVDIDFEKETLQGEGPENTQMWIVERVIPRLDDVMVEWRGAVTPTFQLMGRSAAVLMTASTPGSCHLTWT